MENNTEEPLIQQQQQQQSSKKKSSCCPCFSSKKKQQKNQKSKNQEKRNQQSESSQSIKGYSMQEPQLPNTLISQNQKISKESQNSNKRNYFLQNEELEEEENDKISNHDSELRDHFGSLHNNNQNQNYFLNKNVQNLNQNMKSESFEELEEEKNEYLKKYKKNELVLLNQDQYNSECIIGKITEKNLSFKNSVLMQSAKNKNNEKQQWSKRYYFSQHQQIKIQDEQYDIVTPEVISKYIAERAQKCSIILDAFCGIGGNTIQFAKNCDYVFANDINKQCIEFTKHNCKVYQVERNVEYIQDDYFNLKGIYPDLTFLNPQYTKSYEFDGRIDLFENFVPDLQSSLNFAFKKSKNLMLFLPANADISQIPSLFSKVFETKDQIETISVEIEKIMVNDNLEFFLIYYGPQITNIKGFQEQDLIQKLISGKKQKSGLKQSFMENNGLRHLLENIRDKIGIKKLLHSFLQVYNENKDTEKEFIEYMKQEKVITDEIVNMCKESSTTKSYTQSHEDAFLNDLYSSQNKSQFVNKQGGHNSNQQQMQNKILQKQQQRASMKSSKIRQERQQQNPELYNSEKINSSKNKNQQVIGKSSLSKKPKNQFLNPQQYTKKPKVQFQEVQNNQIQSKREEGIQNSNVLNSQKDEVFIYTNSWDDTGVFKDQNSLDEESYSKFSETQMSPNFQMDIQEDDSSTFNNKNSLKQQQYNNNENQSDEDQEDIQIDIDKNLDNSNSDSNNSISDKNSNKKPNINIIETEF